MKLYNLLAVLSLFLFTTQEAKAQDRNKPQAVLNHQAIYVMDLQKAADFYDHIIGLRQIEEPFKDNRHAWFKTGPHTSLHIILGADVKKEYYKNHHMCFSVPSLELFIKNLDENNITFEDVAGKKGNITNRVDGVKQIWLQDPDGYWIEINNDPSSF